MSKINDLQHVGTGLRKLRLMHDMTQSAIGFRSCSYISEVERGKRPASLDMFKSFAKAYALTLSELLYFIEYYKSPPQRIRGSKKLQALLEAQRYV